MTDLLGRDGRFGFFVLQIHGWKWDQEKLVMRSPIGKTLPMVSFFRMADKEFALRALERGGTPFGNFVKEG